MPAATAKPGSWFQYANTVWEPGQAKPAWLTPEQEKGWMPGSSITQMTAARGTPEYAIEQAQKNDAQLALNKTNHAKAQADQLAAWKAKRGIATPQETSMPTPTKPGTLGQGFASAMDPWQPKPFASPFAQAAGAPKPTVGPGGAPVAQPRLGPQAPPLGAPPGALGAPGGAGGGLGMRPPGMRPPPVWGGGATTAKPGGGVAGWGGGVTGVRPLGGSVKGVPIPQASPMVPGGGLRMGVGFAQAQRRREQEQAAQPPTQMPGIQMDGGTPQVFPQPTPQPTPQIGPPAPPDPPPPPLRPGAAQFQAQRPINAANRAADRARIHEAAVGRRDAAKAASAARKAGTGVSLGTGATVY